MLDQLVAAGHAVLVQIQDGNAQGGAGGLARTEEETRTVSSGARPGCRVAGEVGMLPIPGSLKNSGGRSQTPTEQKWN